MNAMIAVVIVRHGKLCLGGDEAVAEAGGRVILIGSGTREALAALAGVATDASAIEVGGFQPAAWVELLADVVAGEGIVIVPNGPDGRDLAPRLAARLGRVLHSQAVGVTGTHARLLRHGSFEQIVALDRPAVVTLQPGSRRVDHQARATTGSVVARSVEVSGPGVVARAVEVSGPGVNSSVDLPSLEELEADPATIDLTEARRVVGAGAGLAGADMVARLGQVGLRLGASLGATRVVTDAGWLGHDRQIGTTGVVINPDLYLAFGVSGASQHVMGLGDPSHIIAVNTDASCPMMGMADLAIESDANETLAHLATLLGVAE